jgi:hypothetical protein
MRDRNHDPGSGQPLFVDDDELRRRINPKIGRDRFRSALRALEAKYPDFPRFHLLFRGRYWPAVKAWLDGEQGVGKYAHTGSAEDGPETFDAAAERQARPEIPPDRRGASTLLGRQASRPRPQGLSRQDHPVATGRERE